MWKDELCKLNSEMSQGKRLPRTFFTRDGLTVAKELLGKVLVHNTPIGIIRGIITEVESYMGVEDKGSHTYGGRRTERTEPMFHIGGTSYVYFTYGMYHCMNITTDVVDNPQAVLIRSVVPADKASQDRRLSLRLEASLASIKKRKKAKGEELTLGEIEGKKRSLLKHLADGPGKLCIAMGVTKQQNDIDMVKSDFFYVTEGVTVLPEEIQVGKRIGIDYAEEAADYLWRFYIRE